MHFIPGFVMSGAAGNDRSNLNHVGVDQQRVTGHKRAISNDEERLAMHTQSLQQNMSADRAGNLNFALRVA
jgi:hypothetical protein